MSEQDSIVNIYDIESVRDSMFTLGKEIDSIAHQLELAKIEKNWDAKWYAKALYALKSKRREYANYSEIKGILNRDAKNKQAQTFAKIFQEIAYEYLDEDQFSMILEKTHEAFKKVN